MKKLSLIMGIAALALTGCKNGVEKEYSMEIQEFAVAYTTSEVQEVTHDVHLAHCKKSLSLFNYYIEIPELPTEEYSTLIAKDSDNKVYYHITVDGKDSKVTNHGYEFVRWGK